MKELAMPVAGGVEFKVVGKSGQISIGKSYAGKTLRLERKADGTVVLTAVALVPESQLWTLVEPHRSRIARGVAWAAKTVSAETPIDGLARKASAGRVRGRRR
jgi:ABC-type phosphonate transport system ATPase subunit